MNEKKMADIIADPTVWAEMQQCTSVRELVACLNKAGVECTREEGIQLLRAYERAEAEKETMVPEQPKKSAVGRLVDCFRAVFGSAGSGKRVSAASAVPLARNMPKFMEHMGK